VGCICSFWHQWQIVIELVCGCWWHANWQQRKLEESCHGWKQVELGLPLTLLCHGIESTLLGWLYDLIFTCCLCAGNSLFIESTQKGRFYGSKSSQPGYVPRETFFIESPQMGQFYESEPAHSWLYRQKLLIRDICPSTCLLSWFLKKFHAKIDKQKKSIESTLLGRFYDKKNGKS
jgi:hypothetical protein